MKPLYCNGWYLQYIFLLYIIFYFVKLTQKIHNHPIIFLIIISLILFLTQREIKAEQSLSFLCGVVFSEYKEKIDRLFKIQYALLMIIFGTCLLLFKQLPIARSSPQIIMNIIQLCIKFPCALGLIIIMHCLSIHPLQNKICTLIGKCSYELYLIHGYTLNIVPTTIVGAVTFFIVTLIISLLYHEFLLRMKPYLAKVLFLYITTSSP